jgi:hypothetical protein
MDPGYCWPDERSVMFTRPRRCSGSHHITSLVSRSVSGWDEVRPWLVAMLQCQRLLSPAPHTMLRIVFVAVDRTQTERSAPHLALMRSPGANAGRCGLTALPLIISEIACAILGNSSTNCFTQSTKKSYLNI